MTDTLRRIIAARTAMLLDDPFFGSLALRLQIVEAAAPEIPTAATNGTSLFANPDFISRLTGDELKAVLAHEVMHCANGHCWRRDGRDLRKWNVAADYAVNGILQEAGYRLPHDALLPDASQKGQSAEWIYARLPDAAGDGGGAGGGAGHNHAGASMGEVLDAPKAAPEQDAANEQQWQQAVQQAAIQAKRQGKLPAGLERMAAEAVQPKVDWRAELRALLERARSDYSWARPNPRYCHMGLYLPMVDGPEMPPLAVAVDTSGSIDAVALAAAKAELEAIIADTSPAAVHVLYADAAVCRADVFERGDAIAWRPKGGGGTDFRPALLAADALDPAPAALIYITDLYGSFGDQPPAVPVIWLTTTRDTTAPFGTTLGVTA